MSNIQYRNFFRVILTIIITFATISSTAAQNSGDPNIAVSIDENPLVRDAQEYAKDQGINLDEAIRRLQLQDQIGELNTHLIGKEQSTFAGLWIQHSPQYRVIVYFTHNGKETIEPYIKDGALDSIVEVRTANTTLKDLENIQDDTLRAVREFGIPVESGINVFENRVELYVTEGTQLTRALQETEKQLSDSVVIIEVEELSTNVTDIYAGFALTTCTSGFSVQNSSGTKGITTAAHCQNSQSYNGTSLPFQGSAEGAYYDFQWHTAPGFTVRNLAFDGTYNRYVYSTKHRDNQVINEFVCKYGRSTGSGCGYIIDKNYTPTTPGSWCSTFIRVHRDGVDLAEGGDSGGPWFSGNTAYGIMRSQIGNDATYMAINYISYLGISVLTN
ncbi:MAG: hypothetical protein JXA21_03710 [Anaerolineae bacterium]|nr:hypothetical protein [Anaerolineae bacterium]